MPTTYMPPDNLQYASDEENHVTRHLDGLEKFTFTYDGCKVNVWHDGPTLVYAVPNAKSKDAFRSHALHISAKARTFTKQIGGQHYTLPPFGPRKIMAALLILVECWSADPSRDYLYKIVGVKSGRCAICGRFLTVPESMARGIGPECIQSIYGAPMQRLYIKALVEVNPVTP